MSEPSPGSTDMRPCPKCEAEMVRGTLLDRGHGNFLHASRWVLGLPRFSRFWGGLQTKNALTFRVTTWRCVSCGYLESYALEQEPRG